MFRCVVILSVLFPLIFTQDDLVEDTQYATCQINSTEVQTSANATVKRQLKGVCTYKQIEQKFEQLEERLLTELNQIKQLLGGSNIVVKTNDYYDYEEKSLKFDSTPPPDEESIVSVTEIVTRDATWARTEIEKLNNTLYVYKGENVYTYYWKISEIDAILPKKGIHLRSSDFFVLGHQLCLQMYPNHIPNYLGIQLRPNSNFMKKHKFTILDQFDSSKDINSQKFGGLSSSEGLYKVPYAKLHERNYLFDDTLLVKVTIYINS